MSAAREVGWRSAGTATRERPGARRWSTSIPPDVPPGRREDAVEIFRRFLAAAGAPPALDGRLAAPARWPLAGSAIPHEWWAYALGFGVAPAPAVPPVWGAHASAELDPLRPFRSYAGRAEHAGEAIAAIYGPAFYRPRLERGEWARAYRRDQAAAAARRRLERTPRRSRR